MNSLQTKMKISQLNQTKYHAHDILEENTWLTVKTSGFMTSGLHKLWQPGSEKMEREWENEEEMERE